MSPCMGISDEMGGTVIAIDETTNLEIEVTI